LEPRAAVIAGLVGAAIAWLLSHYVIDYTAWGLTPPQRKNWGTALMVVGFALPYWVVKWLVKR
jgi:hypothetical protein